MRRKVSLPLSESQRKALIAGIIARDPKLSLDYTKSLRSHASADIRFAATLAIAYTLAKQDLAGNRETIARLLKDLRRDEAKVTTYPTSDVDFLAAILAEAEGARGKAMHHLEKALAKEPTFFNARVLVAKLQIRKLAHSQFVTTHRCKADYDRLIAHLTGLLRLEPCPRMAVHVELYLSRWFRQPERTAPLAAAQVYLAIMAWRPERAKEALARFVKLSGGTGCGLAVARELAQFVDVAARELKGQ